MLYCRVFTTNTDVLMLRVLQKVCRMPAEGKNKLDNSWLDLFSLRNILNKIFGDEKYTLMVYMLPYSPRPGLFSSIA